MGMNHSGEISELTKIAKPTLSVITNIGTSHIGNLGSRENILKAKLEILEGMESPKLVINNDNDLLNLWYKQKPNIEVHTFGIENDSECMATEIEKNENSSKFICKIKNEKININVPVGGEAFILNAMCATLIGNLLGLSNEEIYKGISTFELTKRRMEIIKIKNNITIVNDCYNASFDSMKSALEYLSKSTAKRKIAVLGDMFELGEFTEELHRKVGEEVAKNKIDLLFVIGEASKYIKDEAIKNGFDEDNVFYLKTQEELLKTINNIILPEDIILFKASNGMKLFEVVEKLK
jgi:UDP-N-acetylmuramoyl-tripeptide--D-alanyl-D-alanine ligase